MALISAFTVIRSIALLHITLGYYFFTNPQMIADQNLVHILGGAMDLPHATDFNRTTPVTALLAVILAFLGVSDLIAVSISEPIAVEYWSAVTPLRLLFLFPVTAYTYLHQPAYFAGVKSRNPGDHLKNGITFALLFIETVMWFWAYVALKEQRRKAAMRVLEARKK